MFTMYLSVTLGLGLVSGLLFMVWCLMYDGEDWGRTWIKAAGLGFLTCWAWPVWLIVGLVHVGMKFSQVLDDDRSNQ